VKGEIIKKLWKEKQITKRIREMRKELKEDRKEIYRENIERKGKVN